MAEPSTPPRAEDQKDEAEAPPEGLVAYRFVCLGEKQVTNGLDLQTLSPNAYRPHALDLLRAYGAANAVEVWTSDGLVEVIPRDGVRVWPEPQEG